MMNIPTQRKQPADPTASAAPSPTQMRTPAQGAPNAPSPPPPPAPVTGGFTPMEAVTPGSLVAPRQTPSMSGAAAGLDPAALLQLLMGKPYTPPSPMGGGPNGY